MNVFKVQTDSFNYIFAIKEAENYYYYLLQRLLYIIFFIIDKGNEIPFFNNVADVNIECSEIINTELSL